MLNRAVNTPLLSVFQRTQQKVSNDSMFKGSLKIYTAIVDFFVDL